MNIRAKLTLWFFGIFAMVLISASVAIYFFSADYRREDFYMRLRNKAENTAKLLIEVDEVDVSLLKRIERDNPSNLPDERITIFNYKNEELYSSDTGDSLKITPATLDRIRLEGEIRFEQGTLEMLGFLFTDKYDRFAVVCGATDIYGLRKMENLRDILLIVIAISFVIGPLSGWLYAGRALDPISDIVTKVDNISAARLDLRLDEGNGSDELAKLSMTFNKMLSRLESAFLSQRNFIANASHELRTPITVVAGEIEVALLTPRSAENYVHILESLHSDIKNLGALSNQLLLLAQTSTDGPDYTFSHLRVDEILWSVKDEMLKARPEYHISINFDLGLNDEALVIRCDEQLMKTVFSNLIDNGCKYSDDQSITINLTSTQDILFIGFNNHGAGISRDEQQSVFEPFFRGKNTRSISGYGIGLSLVSRIVKLHNGSIDVTSVPGEMTRFMIQLPVDRVQA